MNMPTPDEVQYESTGWGSLSDAKGGSGEWLDFKQGQGDTHVVRIIEVHGIRLKSFRGGKPNKHLEMTFELHESNGEVFDPPKIVKTNPRASWCSQLRKESERLATEQGWDGKSTTFPDYANIINSYFLRITRNDDPVSNRGNLDVENIGHIDGQPELNEDGHIEALNAATSTNELRQAFAHAFQSTTDSEQRDKYKALYEERKPHVVEDAPVPF